MLSSFVSLASVLLAAGIILALVLSAATARALLRPPRMTERKAMRLLDRVSPAELGLPFEDMRFEIIDKRTGKPLALNAWWIPNERGLDRCLILLHGYADAKVGAVAWAPLFHALGWSLLAIDLRAHGESGGRFCSVGYWERHDISAVIDELRSRQPALRHIGLFGVSLGAAVAAATAASREALACAILDSCLLSPRSAMIEGTRAFGLPGRLLPRLALFLAERFARADFASVAPLVTLPQVRCPLMLIHSTADVHVSPADAAALDAAAKSRQGPAPVIWRAQGALHLMAMADQPEEYLRQAGTFLDEAIGAAKSA